MPDDLYEKDVLIWSERQADLLRRLAAGERVNAAIDWQNVIEEVNDVGQSQLRACQSFLINVMLHLLKLHAWPQSLSAAQWRGEIDRFAADAELAFSPGMRQRILLDELYAKARKRALRQEDASGEPRPLPERCPYTLDALFDGDIRALLPLLDPPAPD